MHARIPERRAFLRTTCRGCLALAALASGLAARAEESTSPDDEPLPPRFQRPPADSDEGGLWAMFDREEARIERSPLTIRDKGLVAYLHGVVERLEPVHAPDIRVHPVRMPAFNAMMAPNGMMIVWSGLLLRVENEAQLAAILGHEMGHYLERHGIEQLRAARDAALMSQLVAMIGGVGNVAGQIGLTAGMFAYSRDHEWRADHVGMRLMKQAGYDPRQVPIVWDNLLAEARVTEGEDAGKSGDLFADHPTTASRRDDLRRLAEQGGGGTDLGTQRLRDAIAPRRMVWITDEIKRGQFEESLVLFNRLAKDNPQDAQVLYARGEIYRLRDEGGDRERAVADLQHSSTLKQSPAETFRALGLIYQQGRDNAAAAQAFQQYLALAPQAPDAGLVRSYLTDLKP